MYARRKIWIGKFVAFGLLMIILVGLITQFLWNFIMPEVFGLPMITFWQGVAMFVLAKIIFGFGGGGRGRWGGYSGHRWKREWAEKYSKLSPEDRERFKQKLKDKWCSWEEDSVKTTEPQKDPQ